MQINYQFTPMVKSFILKNIPHGGYQIVAKRLGIERSQVKQAVRYLDHSNDHVVLRECCQFIKESNIELDTYANEYMSFK